MLLIAKYTIRLYQNACKVKLKLIKDIALS